MILRVSVVFQQAYVYDPDMLLLLLSLPLSIRIISVIFLLFLIFFLHRILFVDTSAQTLCGTCNPIWYVLNCLHRFVLSSFFKNSFCVLYWLAGLYHSNTKGVFSSSVNLFRTTRLSRGFRYTKRRQGKHPLPSFWYARLESNQRPSESESDALSNWATGTNFFTEPPRCLDSIASFSWFVKPSFRRNSFS